MATRWGIVSAGKISSDFVFCLQMQKKEEHQVCAVAARQLESAQTFAKRFAIPKTYGSYQELANDSDIDIAYIGTIHAYHYEMIKMMINAGKHVLCEKPFVLNCKQAKEVLQLAKEKGVFFMEGFWSRFFPAYVQLRKELEENSIGEVRMVCVNFGDACKHIPRMNNHATGGGALLDLGCYPVMFVNQIFKEKPLKVIAASVLSETGCDETTTISMVFSGNRMATIYCSMVADLDNSATIYGSKGMIKIPHFWSPVTLITPNKTHEFPLPKVDHEFNFRRSEGFLYEQQCIRECLAKGLQECPIMPWEDSMTIMEIMDAARAQTGLTYEADK